MARSLGAHVLIILSLCALALVLAHADSARAEQLISQANQLRRERKAPQAMPLLRQAYEIARSSRTAAQLGLVELARGYWLEAEDHLSEALAPARHPWVDQYRKVLEASLADARSHVGTLVVEGKPPGASVTVNSRSVGTFPLPAPIRLAEGNVTIEVRAPDHAPQKRTIRLRGATTQEESFELAEGRAVVTPPSLSSAPALPPAQPTSPLAPAAPPTADTGHAPWRRVLPWTLAAAAVVAGGVAVWQHVEWRDAQVQYEGNPACYTRHPKRGTDGGSMAFGRGPGLAGLSYRGRF